MNQLRVIFLLAVSAILATAQSGTSTLSGQVKDPSGAPIPAARVRVVNTDTGVRSLPASTNDSGLYRFNALLPGRYRIEAEAEGFEQLTRSNLTLEVSQTLAVDLTLTVGKQSETVVVNEAAPLVDSQSSNVGQLVNRQMLDGLPLPNRAAASLAALAPGVVMIDSGAGTAENYPIF